jgi:hypothetical protein
MEFRALVFTSFVLSKSEARSVDLQISLRAARKSPVSAIRIASQYREHRPVIAIRGLYGLNLERTPHRQPWSISPNSRHQLPSHVLPHKSLSHSRPPGRGGVVRSQSRSIYRQRFR